MQADGLFGWLGLFLGIQQFGHGFVPAIAVLNRLPGPLLVEIFQSFLPAEISYPHPQTLTGVFLHLESNGAPTPKCTGHQSGMRAAERRPTMPPPTRTGTASNNRLAEPRASWVGPAGRAVQRSTRLVGKTPLTLGCPRGGTGRHPGLGSQCSVERDVGSNPTGGTTYPKRIALQNVAQICTGRNVLVARLAP